MQLEFKIVFAEDKDTKLYPPIRKGVEAVYYYIKLVIYHFLALTLGVFLMALFAVSFAISAFIINWMVNPALQMSLVVLRPVLQFPMKVMVIHFSPLTVHQVKAIRKICPQRWYR